MPGAPAPVGPCPCAWLWLVVLGLLVCLYSLVTVACLSLLAGGKSAVPRQGVWVLHCSRTNLPAQYRSVQLCRELCSCVGREPGVGGSHKSRARAAREGGPDATFQSGRWASQSWYHVPACCSASCRLLLARPSVAPLLCRLQFCSCLPVSCLWFETPPASLQPPLVFAMPPPLALEKRREGPASKGALRRPWSGLREKSANEGATALAIEALSCTTMRRPSLACRHQGVGFGRQAQSGAASCWRIVLCTDSDCVVG